MKSDTPASNKYFNELTNQTLDSMDPFDASLIGKVASELVDLRTKLEEANKTNDDLQREIQAQLNMIQKLEREKESQDQLISNLVLRIKNMQNGEDFNEPDCEHLDDLKEAQPSTNIFYAMTALLACMNPLSSKKTT